MSTSSSTITTVTKVSSIIPQTETDVVGMIISTVFGSLIGFGISAATNFIFPPAESRPTTNTKRRLYYAGTLGAIAGCVSSAGFDNSVGKSLCYAGVWSLFATTHGLMIDG